MGISLNPDGAPGEIQHLAERAMAGDKNAQLELGILYQEGRGVPINLRTAKRLYVLAARDSGGTAWIYAPSVQTGQPGRVLQISRGAKKNGLDQAKRRLATLEEGE